MKLTQLLIIRDNDVLEQEQESLEAETADQSPENLPFWSPDEQIDDLVSALKDSQLGTEDATSSPDWAHGLPLDVLALIAGGRDVLKSMRGVNTSWQQGFDSSVTKLTIGLEGPLLPVPFTQRFLGLACLDLGNSKVAEADLAQLAGLKRLRSLTLGAPLAGKDRGELRRRLTGAGLQHLKELMAQHLSLKGCKNLPDGDLGGLRGLPLTSLDLESCAQLTGVGLSNLRGAPLISLDLGGCRNLTELPISLQSLPLTNLSLQRCNALATLEGMRSWPLTSLNLSGCALFRDTDLEPLQNLPLSSLSLCGMRLLSGVGLGYLRALPLTSLSLGRCHGLFDGDLAILRGQTLTRLDLGGCFYLTGEGLKYLLEMPLQNLNLSDCGKLQMKFLDQLKGIPSLNLESSIRCY